MKSVLRQQPKQSIDRLTRKNKMFDREDWIFLEPSIREFYVKSFVS